MGYIRVFGCSCGYEAEISGGWDCGMEVATQSILCRKCRKLYDVEVCPNIHRPQEEQIHLEPECPKSKKHKVELWKHPGPCPRCGKTMEITCEGGLWD